MTPPDDLHRVLGPFADPATPIEIAEAPSGVRVRLVQGGGVRQYFIDRATGLVKASEGVQRQYSSLDSLLASPEFADLRAMASTQQRTLSSAGTAFFLEPNMTIGPPESQHIGLSALQDALQSSGSGKTRIVLVDGPAGIGKTRLLERLTWLRAEAYLMGSGLPPILYVGSRGSRLSNLQDTLAKATQVVRAKFTFEQVPILVKRGLLHLAIDGFDELVDADGYKDAWYALRGFLEELSGGGVCVLAGRDTFFNQQGFLSRLEAAGSRVDLVQAHLGPAKPQEAKRWLLQSGWPEAEVSSSTSDEILQTDAYTLRPYFLSVLADAHSWTRVTEEHSVRSFLVAQFLDREARLLETMIGISSSDAFSALEEMFEEVAMDMAERESTEVDIEYLGFLCELAFEKFLPTDDLRKLQHKAGSFALLERSTSDRLRQFPHSEIFHHFLARSILKALAAHSLPLVLRRGVLGSDFIEVFQDIIDSVPEPQLKEALDFLRSVIEEEISSDRLSYNGGALLVASLTRPLESDPRVLSNLVINETTITGPAAEATLSNLEIFRLDAREADLSQVHFEKTRVSALIVDALTKFGVDAPEVHTIYVTEQDEPQTLRAPQDIQAWLAAHSSRVSETGSEALRLVQYFDRVCRRAIRQFYFRPGAGDAASILLQDPLWPEVEDILQREGRLEKKQQQMSGPRNMLIHIKAPRLLLQPPEKDNASRNIRDMVIARARELG